MSEDQGLKGKLQNTVRRLSRLGSGNLRTKLLLGLVGLVVLGGAATMAARTQAPLKASLASRQSVRVDGPLKIDFNQEVAEGFKARIEPAMSGAWSNTHTLLGVSAATFSPGKRFEAGRTYKLRITGLKRVATGASIPDIEQTFTAQTPAAVKSFAPSSGAKNMAVKPRLSVELAEANRNVRLLKASLVPAVPLKLVSDDDKTFVWEPAAPLQQGVTYTFVLEDARMTDAAKRALLSVPFTTVTQPKVLSARTGGYLAPGQSWDLVFDQPMEQTADGLQYELAGKGSWTDDHTYHFTPTDLKPGTTYVYKVKPGAKSKAGGVFEGEQLFRIATNGAVNASTSPGGEVGVNTTVRVAFDQAVDHASAESRFSMTPAVAGKFSWSGNTMTFAPNGLSYQTNYAFSVAPGVSPAWGLPSARPLGGSFVTVVETIKLGVPAYKGQYWMACELSSLRMLLAYRGIMVDDWAILMRLNYNPRPRDTGSNSWDNPNVMFVGDVNGRPNKTGYGVHAGPLADAGRSFGRNTSAYFNVSAQFISARIHEGNPVAFYSYSDAAPRADGWNTPQGWVNTMYPQHARVIYGVKGNADAPLGFYINEPMNGSTFYWSAAEVMNHMNAVPGVSNQAVVVY